MAGPVMLNVIYQGPIKFLNLSRQKLLNSAMCPSGELI
jgi:hypothetical protein